jgi:hypothetical protein
VISYPVEVETTDGDVIEVWVVVTYIEPYRAATRFAPAEGGVYDWHFSTEQYGEPVDLDVTPKSVSLVERYMENDIRSEYDD